MYHVRREQSATTRWLGEHSDQKRTYGLPRTLSTVMSFDAYVPNIHIQALGRGLVEVLSIFFPVKHVNSNLYVVLC